MEGVTDYCYFLKQLSDARLIRNRILECFEVIMCDIIIIIIIVIIILIIIAVGAQKCLERVQGVTDYLTITIYIII